MSPVPESAPAGGGVPADPALRSGVPDSAARYEDEDFAGPLSPLPQHEDPPLPSWVGVLAGAVPLALGIGGIYGSLALGIGSIGNPGPGLWPLVLSVAISVAAVVLLVLGHGLHGAERFGRGWRIVAVAAMSLVAFTYLFEPLGFEIPTLLLLAFWLRVIGKETWRMTAMMSIGTTVVVYLIFIVGLSVNLPRLIAF